MRKSRIDLMDSVQSVVVRLAEGNPGAIHVCMEMLTNETKVDPDCAFAGLGALLSLDTHGIYGSRIWMLYKDVCRQSIVLTLAALRSVQLGHTSEGVLLNAIDRRGEGFDPVEAHRLVKGRLPKFADYEVPVEDAAG